VKSCQEEVKSKHEQVKGEDVRLQGLHDKLKEISQTTGTKEEKAAALQSYLKQDELKSKELDKQIKSLKEQGTT
jgi:septal ring factor EnvC (AmiA/AmiB activator)